MTAAMYTSAQRANLALRARALAWAIDSLLVLLAGFGLFVALQAYEAPVSPMIWLWLLYPLLGEVWTGRTIGKELMGIHVEMLDGRPLTRRAALVRSVLRPIDCLLIIPVLAVLMMWHTGPERRQRIGDYFARTVVVADAARRVKPFASATLTVPALGATLAAFALLFPAWMMGRRDAAERHYGGWCDRTWIAGTSDCGCVYDALGEDRVYAVFGRDWWREPVPADVAGAVSRCAPTRARSAE